MTVMKYDEKRSSQKHKEDHKFLDIQLQYLLIVLQFENILKLYPFQLIVIRSTWCTSCCSNYSSKNTIQSNNLIAVFNKKRSYGLKKLQVSIGRVKRAITHEEFAYVVFLSMLLQFSLQYQLERTSHMNYEFTLIPQDAISMSVDEHSTAPLVVIPIGNNKNCLILQGDSRRKSKKKHWKPQQNIRYIQFLKNHLELFEKNREDKRLMKINILMSKHVRSKNSTQCRSHHQKMLIHYKTIENIIASLQWENCSEQLQDRDQVAQNIQNSVQNNQVLEFIEEFEPEKQVERSGDVFQVLDNNCWGYTNGFNFQDFLF